MYDILWQFASKIAYKTQLFWESIYAMDSDNRETWKVCNILYSIIVYYNIYAAIRHNDVEILEYSKIVLQ